MDNIENKFRKIASILFAVLLITGTSTVAVLIVMPGVFAQTSGENADTTTEPTVSLEHDAIEIGQPVTWTQTIELATPDAVAVEVPADAQITDVQTSSGETVDLDSVTTTDAAPADATLVSISDPQMLQEGADTTLAVIDESADGYNISFETPAPYTVENDTSTADLYQKEVTVAHDSALHYTDVKSYSDIPEELVSQGVEFKLFWMVDGVKTDVTSNPQYAVSFVDTNGNGISDQMQWNVPQLSEQQFVIEGIILASDAEHLDSNRNVVANVYDQIKARDGTWTDPIPAGDYVRVTFEKDLNNTNDITIFAKSDSPGSSIEVYEKDSNVLLATFGTISNDGLYKIYLTNLNGNQNTFDLKIVGNPVEFDNIIDPFNSISATLNGASSVAISPGASITAAVTVNTVGNGANDDWESTGWLISTSVPTNAQLICVDTTDYLGGGTNTDSFIITAPGAPGTYNAYFKAFNSNDCTTSNPGRDVQSALFTMTGAVEVGSVVAGEADVGVSKSGDVDPVLAGNNLVYTVTVTNYDDVDDATNVVVTDLLPAGVTYVGPASPDICTESPVGTLTCDFGSVSPGSPESVDITVTVPVGTHTGTITNNASVESDNDQNSANDSTSLDTAVAGEADVGIEKSDDVDPVLAGNNLVYTVTVTNNDDIDDATHVVVTDVLPAGVTYVSPASQDICTELPAGTLTCDFGSVSPGSPESVDITVTVDVGTQTGTITNEADVTSDNDPNAANDSASEDTDVIGEADVSITKSDDVDPVLAGNNLVYTVTVTNNDLDDAATNLTVTDTLPTGVTYVSAIGTDWTCGEAAGVVTCTRASLDANTSSDITITVTIPVDTHTGTITNEADVTSDNDQNPANDSASEDTDVIGEADVGIDKTGPAYAIAGNNLVYTVTVTNYDDFDDATHVVVTDVLPAGVTYVSPAVPDICTESPVGTLTCDFGSVSPGSPESVVITVTVNANTPPGILTNTVSVVSDNDQNPANDSDSASTSLLPAVLITNGAAYPGFDRSNDPGRQFNNILTHIDALYYKDTATNPGQFFLYLFYIGEPGSPISGTDLVGKIPFPFVTQGAQPIHVYSNAAISSGSVVFSGEVPFTASGTATVTPSGALGISLTDYTPKNFGTNLPVTFGGTVPSTGLFMVRVHLDWGLKGTSSYAPNAALDATPIVPNIWKIKNLDNFKFEMTGDVSGSETIQNKNIFKNDRGIFGLVLSSVDSTPQSGVIVELWSSGAGSQKLGATSTDDNGYYSFKVPGKAATYLVKVPSFSKQTSVTVQSNQFAFAQFLVP